MRFLKQLKKFDKFLIILGIFVFIFYTPLITPIGIFLYSLFGAIAAALTYLLVIVAAGLFFILILARICQLIFGYFFSSIHYAFCLFLSLMILTLPPFLMNRKIDATAQYLTKSNMNTIDKSVSLDSIALVTNDSRFKNQCEQFCQRLLINKQVKKVIMAKTELVVDALSLNIEGTVYWMEQRDNCPETHLTEAGAPFKPKFMDFNSISLDPRKLISHAALNGDCLLSKKQVIRAADLAIFQLNQPKVEPIPIYLKNPYISTSKLIAYSHNAETKLKVFQATQVRLYKLFPFLFVPPTGGYSFHFRQEPSHIGGPNKLRQPPIQLLLTHEFGLNLQIDDQKFAKQLQTEVIASLGQNQIITANLSKLYDLYFDSISRQFKPDETDVKLTLKLLSIDGFPMLNSIKNALRRILPQHDQYKEQFAQQLFNKLNAFTPDKSEEFISRQYRELRYINNALGELPLDSYNISLERLNELAKDRYDREFNYNVFKFLANYGDAALPTLFYLLEDDDPEPLVDSQHRSRLISTVMQNICLIGLGADKLQNQMIIERIYKWLNSDDYPLSGRNKRPTISTMIGLGAEPEKLWLHIKSNEKNALSYKRFKKITEYKLNKKCKYH